MILKIIASKESSRNPARSDHADFDQRIIVVTCQTMNVKSVVQRNLSHEHSKYVEADATASNIAHFLKI